MSDLWARRSVRKAPGYVSRVRTACCDVYCVAECWPSQSTTDRKALPGTSLASCRLCLLRGFSHQRKLQRLCSAERTRRECKSRRRWPSCGGTTKVRVSIDTAQPDRSRFPRTDSLMVRFDGGYYVDTAQAANIHFHCDHDHENVRAPLALPSCTTHPSRA